MKKIFNRNLLFMLSFIALLVAVEVAFSSGATNKSLEGENNIDNSEINLGSIFSKYANYVDEGGGKYEAQNNTNNSTNNNKNNTTNNSSSSKPSNPTSTCKLTSISGPKQVSVGDKFNLTFSFSGSGCTGLAVKGTIDGASPSSFSVGYSPYGPTTYSFTAGSCPPNTISYSGSLSGGLGGSGSGTIVLESQFHCSDINCTEINLGVDPTSHTGANYANKNYYYDNKGCTTFDGKKGYSSYCTRKCGGGPSAPPPPPPPPACWANATSLDNATEAVWTNDPPASYHQLLGISEKVCIPLKTPSFCDPSQKSPTVKNLTATRCEDSIPTTYKDGYYCDGNSFYKISCDDNKISVKYDNDNDFENGNIVKNVKKMLAGEGIGFAVTVEAVRVCDVTFNESNFMKAYNHVKRNYDKTIANKSGATAAEKDILERYEHWFSNQLKELREYVTNYNKYEAETSLNPKLGTEIKFELNGYKVLGKREELKATLVPLASQSKEGKGTVTGATTHHLGISGLTNPKSYHWSNAANPQVTKYVFAKTYLEPTIGTVIDDDTAIDGGNKLYIDYDTDASKTGVEYPMVLDLSSKIVNINNKKCKIRVFDSEFLYRPINVSNPFINDSHEIGKNWLNSLYDFTKTIQENIWDKRAQHDIRITSSQIDALKKSNSDNRNKSPYLGLCDRESYSLLDGVTKKLCDCLKNSSCTIK